MDAMDGWPVWLASLSVRDVVGNSVPTSEWTPASIAWGETVLGVLLDALGDAGRERSFRMCLTLCRHRALSKAEHDALPEEWCALPGLHLAGGSLEILWETVPGAASTRPCEAPVKNWMSQRIWLPEDCGECEPCRARATVEADAS